MIIADSATHAQGNTRDGVTVDIPGHVMAESGVTKVAVTVVPDIPVGDETIYTQHTTNLVEITVVPGLTGKIVVTTPFDTTDVDPGDFKAKKAVIYYAPTADDLQNAIKGPIKSVPASGLVYEDHLAGVVSFKVVPASVFGAGAAIAPPLLPPAEEAPPIPTGDDSGCFISTIDLW